MALLARSMPRQTSAGVVGPIGLLRWPVEFCQGVVMGRLVPVEVDGVQVLVQAVVEPGDEGTSGRADEAAQKVLAAFDHAQDVIVGLGSKLAGSVAELGRRGCDPSQVQVEFGLAVTTKGNIVVVGAEAEASVKVSITYDRPPRSRPVGGP